MSNSTPLKLKDASGNLQQFNDSSDLDYINVQSATWLAGATSNWYMNTTSGNAVGSHTDTVYDQAVGSHPNLTISTTTTNLYQNYVAPATPTVVK